MRGVKDGSLLVFIGFLGRSPGARAFFCSERTEVQRGGMGPGPSSKQVVALHLGGTALSLFSILQHLSSWVNLLPASLDTELGAPLLFLMYPVLTYPAMRFSCFLIACLLSLVSTWLFEGS